VSGEILTSIEAAPTWRANRQIIVFAGLLTVQFWLIFNHAPWWDEHQALLIAQQSLPQIFHSLHYEGHPALWYLILHALSAALPPSAVLPVAQAPIALGVLALIWFRAPFAPWLKLLVSLGYFVAFEYGVIARSYGLGVLLFFAFVTLRRTPWAWLLLALLANVALHTALLAGVCALWQIAEGRWSWRGATLLAVSGGLFLLTVWPAPNVVPAQPLDADLVTNFLLGCRRAASLLLPVDPRHYPAVWQWTPPLGAAILIGLLLPLVGVLALRRRWRDAALFSLLAFAMYALPVVLYVSFPRHWGVLAVLFLGLLWGQVEDGLGVTETAVGWLGAMALGGVTIIATALTQPFALDRQIGAWVVSRGLQTQPWASSPPFNGVGLTGETGIPTYNPIKRCWQTFHRWDYEAYPKFQRHAFEWRINAYANDNGGGYLISNHVIWTMSNAKPLAYFDSPMMGQWAYLYYIRPLAPAPKSRPACR
jgi:hypothetical protein